MYRGFETPANLGAAIDDAERKLANARRVRDEAMSVIEASRRGTHKISTADYINQKLRHGNAEADVRYWKHALRNYSGWYSGRLASEWMRPQYEAKACNVSLKQVWQCWRDVLAARDRLACLSAKIEQPISERWAHDFLNDMPDAFVGTARERIEAQAAVDCVAGLYDIALRAFEGRAPRSHDVTLKIDRVVKAPKLPQPTSGRRKPSYPIRSTFIGA